MLSVLFSRSSQRIAAAGVLAGMACFASTAKAVAVSSVSFYDGNVLDVHNVVGTGSDTAYLVLNYDGNSSTSPPPVVAWQYNFTPPTDGSTLQENNLIDAIAADPASDFSVVYDPKYDEDYPQYFLYNRTTNVRAADLYFTAGSYDASTLSASDPQGISWSGLEVGIQQEPLTSGFYGITGLDAAGDYPGPDPVAPETAVPEPTLLSGGVLLSCALLRRRRNLA